MSDRAYVLAARVILAAIVAALCFGGPALGQGQRKETTSRKAISSADPSLLPIVEPGTSFTYRITLKRGFRFDAGNGDGIFATATRGNIVIGAMRRVSSTVAELDISSADNGVGGSATIQVNVTNSKGRLKFVRAAIAIALPGGNELVTVDARELTIASRLGVGTRPNGVDTASTGSENFKTAFVCNTGSATVTAVDIPSNTVVATIPVGVQPTYVAIAGVLGSQFAYVTNAGSNSVSVIDADTFAVVATIAVGSVPQGIAMVGQPGAGELAYVANRDDDTVSVIDVTTNTVIQTFSVGDGPTGVAVTGRIGLQTVAVTEANASTVALVDPNSNTVITHVPVGTRPVAVTVGGPTQNLFFVANQGGDSVSFVDINTNTETNRVLVGSQPSGVTVTGAGALEEVWTANTGDGTVSVVDVSNAQLVFTVPIGGRPRGVATIGPISLPSVLVTN
jgi:YVTN family beta-propeller protein